jgi:hypothetical protein
MIRWCLLFSLVFFASCSSVRMSQPEIVRVALFAEDLAHGQDRTPGDLIDPDGTEGLTTMALFFGHPGHIRLPQPFDFRRQRWPLIQELLVQNTISADAQGFLLPRDGAGTKVLRLIEAENRDRQMSDLRILNTARIDPSSASGSLWIRTVVAERIRHAKIHQHQ